MNLAEPMCRTTDPETSHIAAGLAVPLQRSHARLIHAALQAFGPMSKDDIAAMTGLSGVQVDRRTVEMQRAGLIQATDRVSPSNSGRPERVWRSA